MLTQSQSITRLADVVACSEVQFGTSGARGLVERMTDPVCSAYAEAFWVAVGSGTRVVLGQDLRPSSPGIAAACCAALQRLGVEVIHAGTLPTPALACYAAQHQLPAIMVTGSHIPFDRNGIKFYSAQGEISKDDEQAMLQVVLSNAVPETEGLPPLDLTPQQDYVQRYVGFFPAALLQGLRVAIYQHSSVARDLLPQILTQLGAEVLPLGRSDGFVPIDTEAVSAEDMQRGRDWAAQHGFDAIISTDGDGDRPLIGDERGEWLRGDQVGMLCARYLGAATVVAPISCNSGLEQCGWFQQVIRTRIGSPYVIEGMQQATSMPVVGFEANGGFLLGSDVQREGRHLSALPTRDAVLPILALLAMAKTEGCSLSELLAQLPPRYTASDRIQGIASSRSHALLAELAQDWSHAAVLMRGEAVAVVSANPLDGLRMSFVDGDIVHLRPSGNAPELRCYCESGSEARARQLCEQSLQRIRQRLCASGA